MKILKILLPIPLFIIFFSCSNGNTTSLKGTDKNIKKPSTVKIEDGEVTGDIENKKSSDIRVENQDQDQETIAPSVTVSDTNENNEASISADEVSSTNEGENKTLPDINFFYGYFTYTNTLAELEGHANVVLGPSSIQFIEEAISRNIKPIVWLSTSVSLFNIVGGRSYLKSNYKEIWEEYASYLKPYIKNIYGFYPIDEPFWAAKASAEDQDKLNRAIKATFPDKPIMTTFALPTLDTNFRVPVTYDYVSVDHYGSSFETDKSYFRKLKSKISGHQKIFLLGDGFHPSTNPISQQGLDLRSSKAYLAYDFAKNSGEPIVGILNYVWDSFTTDWPASTGKRYTAIRDMPGTKETFISVGKTAIENQ